MKKSANMDVFPWLPEFRSKCRSTLGCGTSTLIELIRTFNRNVKLHVSEGYQNKTLAVRLKDLIKEYLLLFMHLYRYEQPQDQNREDYLEQMSDLLAVYIDMELVACQLVPGQEHGLIPARLVSYLCVCLDYSTEHILDTLMKLHFGLGNFSHILEAIISKLLKLIPPKPQSAMTFARYFLVYRLWKWHNDKLVEKPVPAPPKADSLLGPVPANMPDFLLEQVLSAPPYEKSWMDLRPVDFYLQRCLDLRKACSQFLQYCRGRDPPKTGSDQDITERDKRLKSTSTSVPNKLISTVNTNFSKSSNSSVKSLPSSSASNIPRVNSEITKSSCPRRPTVPVKSKIPPKISGIEVIDLTSDEEPKPKPSANRSRRPSRRRLDWLAQAVQGVDSKIREASQKRERELAPSSEEHRNEDSPRRTVPEKVEKARGADEQPTERLELQRLDETSVEPADRRAEVKTEAAEPIADAPIPETPRTSEKILRPSEEDRLSAVSLAEHPSTTDESDESHAEATPRPEEKDRADSGFSESETPVARGKQPEASEAEAKGSFYDIQESNLDGLTLLACVLARQSATSNKSDKALRPKDDERTQDTAATLEHPAAVSATVVEKCGVSSVDESQCNAEPKPRPEEKEVRVNNEANESDAPGARNKQPELSEAEARSSFYDIQESDLDGLTLLACVLARQSGATSNKKAEIKVKPYASLQEKREPESRVVDRIVSICPEDALDKVALQVEVSSSDMVQNRPQQELVSYMMEEPVQSSLESNDTTNVILNGETVRLLQKSPNSNLYIINKAAVDNSKMNYNSDEEDGGKPIEPEETKCCPQGLLIKHEPDDVGLPRGRTIKPDPDYVGQPQPHDMHYPGHPATGYCGYATKLHQQPSAGCACLNCVYCRQLPYYLPAQPVQPSPAVQEKRCGVPTAAEAKLYEDQLLKQQPPQLLEPAAEDPRIDKYNLTESRLPLKKRLKAQRMSMGYVEQPSPAYPGTLMMSIADVELRPGHAALELGAEVEIATSAAKTTSSRSRSTAKEAKIKNQNMPNCFPRKSGKKKSKPEEAEEEEVVEPCLGASAPKKPRKSGSKQTRSSRRAVTSVNYVYPEIDPEWNPSGKRKRKRSSR